MKKIVLCTSRVFDTQVHGFIEKLNKNLVSHDCSLLIFAINKDIYWEEDNISAETTVFDIIPYMAVDAVIIMDEKIKSRTVAKRIIGRAQEYGTPVIIVDGHYEGLPYVNYDYAKGFEQVVRHVLDRKKLKKPHMMAGIPGNPFSQERENIFRKVVQEYGFTFDKSMISYGYFWARPALEATEAIVASGDIPDAIICANDIMALNVSEVLRQNGLKIPEDVMISGFDGYDEVLITSPKITTVSCVTQGLADATSELVLQIVEGGLKNVSESDGVEVVPSLVPNESTGCKAFSGYDESMLSRMNDRFYRYQDSVRPMHEVATAMQLSRTPDEMTSCVDMMVINDRHITKDMLFILNRKLFDMDHYYFDQPDTDVVTTDYNLVYDIARSTKLVEMSPIEALYRPDDMCVYPLIFNALDYMNKPLGYISYFYKHFDISDYSRTADVTNTLSMGVGGYVIMTYQRYLAAKVDDMYKHDYLTGLYNRIGFINAFDEFKDLEENQGKSITVIMSDLDGLKYINDHFGHVEGDNAIATVARAMKKACPDDAFCVRLGGDEMASVITGECNAPDIISRIEMSLDEYNKSSGKDYLVSASCGFGTAILDSSLDIKKVIRLADEEMYDVKKTHRKSRDD